MRIKSAFKHIFLNHFLHAPQILTTCFTQFPVSKRKLRRAIVLGDQTRGFGARVLGVCKLREGQTTATGCSDD